MDTYNLDEEKANSFIVCKYPTDLKDSTGQVRPKLFVRNEWLEKHNSLNEALNQIVEATDTEKFNYCIYHRSSTNIIIKYPKVQWYGVAV